MSDSVKKIADLQKELEKKFDELFGGYDSSPNEKACKIGSDTDGLSQIQKDELSRRKDYCDNNKERLSTEQMDLIRMLPLPQPDQEPRSLIEAKQILDSSHYGLSQVKRKILEFIAVQNRVSSFGRNLLLVSSPGCGKTSIARSIAKAMNKPFYSKSMSGLCAGWEIVGSRSGWRNAGSGCIVDALMKSQSLSPLILLDEIDKMGEGGNHSSPASAMLQLFDCGRKVFIDEFITYPIDLSNVIFVATANNTDKIDPILLDRFETVRLPPYDLQAKLFIAENYIIPEKQNIYKIDIYSAGFENTFIKQVVEYSKEEDGIRLVEKMIDAIFRAAVYAEEVGQGGNFITQRFVDTAIENLILQKRDCFTIGFVI